MRPPRISVKYASTSSRRFGLPYAISSTAVCSGFMNEFHQPLQMLHRAVGQHPMPEVEVVSRALAGPRDHPTRTVLEHRPGPQQPRGIEVSLDAAVVSDQPPGLAQVHPPVDADHVAAGLAH